MKVAVITAALLIAALGFANPSRVVAKYNVEAYLSGKLETIDMDTIKYLNTSSAVPYVWELRDDPDEEVREAALDILFHAMEDRELVTLEESFYRLQEASYPTKSFTFCSYNSFRLLQANSYEILLKSCPYVEQWQDRSW